MLNNLGKVSQETIELTKSAMDLTKAITTTTGIVGYSLEAPAKQLIPFLAPLRNRIPRIVSKTGTAVHWKVITAVTPNGRVTSTEGTRGNSVSTTLVDMLATFKTLGLQDSVTFESLAAGRNFQDVKATAVTNLLLRVMTEEEKQILFGMTSQALSTPTALATSAQTTGGLLGGGGGGTYVLGVTALTGNGVNRNVPRSAPASVAFDMADGTTAAFYNSVTFTSISTGAIYASVTPVYGALGYAWFCAAIGAAATAATYQITTTTNKLLLTTTVTGVTTAASVDTNGETTQDTYAYDGLLSQALWPQTGATGAYFQDLAGAKLTKDNGGISEIDAALQYIFDTWKISPTRILCGAGVQKDITKGIVSGYGAPTLFVNNSEKNAITGNYLAESYINSVFGGRPIPMETHPWLPAGCIIGITEVVPFPNANVPSVFEMEMAYDYTQLEYAVVQPKYEFEVRCFGALKSYFPGGQFVLTNVGSGIQ
jgi:hypothetical protein